MNRFRARALLLLALAGCIWRGYATIVAVHLDVLTQTAAKLCDVVEKEGGPTAEGMAEYVYPAKRAREFLRQFRGYEDRPSYRGLAALLDRYEALVRDVDALRAATSAPDAARLREELRALREAAASIRSDALNGR